MMLTFRKPSDQAIRDFLESRRDAPYTYPHVGASREKAAPAGYKADFHRVRIGRGSEVFRRAVEALRQWSMFPRQMVQPCWPATPLEPGAVLAGLYRGPGVWCVMPCRIVYLIDEETPYTRRFGFGYGTLPGHQECGEERFLVKQRRDTGEVFYDIYAFSRPATWLARIGYPFARHEQARFRRLSAESMQHACGAPHRA